MENGKNKIYERIENPEGLLGIIFFLGMVGASSLGVFFRYVVQSSLTWSEELSRYLFVWIGYFTMSYATIYRKHITIDILTVVFYKKHPQFVLTLRWIGKLLWAAFTFFMIYQGYLMARKSYYSDEISAAMCLPLVFVYSSLSVGFLLMAYWLIKQLIQEFKEIFYRA